MKKAKKAVKKEKKAKPAKDEGESLNDAFADDEDVVYAPSKPRKEKKKKGLSSDEMEEELEEAEEEEEKISSAMNKTSDEKREITFKTSKPILKLKKGDKIKIDAVQYEIDSHSVLIDHGSTKEMAVDIFDPKTDKDYQLRYFDDQAESTLDLYELRDIMYFKKPFKKIEW